MESLKRVRYTFNVSLSLVLIIALIVLTFTLSLSTSRMRYNRIEDLLNEQGISLDHGDQPIGPIAMRETFDDFLNAVKLRDITAVYYDHHQEGRGPLYWASRGNDDQIPLGYRPPPGYSLD